MHACFAQHVDVDPGRYKVGETAGHDDNAPALEEAAVVGRCILLKGLQLSLSTFDGSSVSKQKELHSVNRKHFHIMFGCMSGQLGTRIETEGVDECMVCTCLHNN